VQDESSETTEKKADAANTQDAKICVVFEPCKKTEGCSRLCPIGQKHRGAVGGKMVKPDKMQTGDDEPKWLAHAGCILREKAPQEEMPKRPTTPTTHAPKRTKVANTDESTKKKLASLEKQMATLKKQLAKREDSCPDYLDLFSGTHSVGNVASVLGYAVVSLDLSDATICCNILEWDYKAVFRVGPRTVPPSAIFFRDKRPRQSFES